MPRGNGVHHEHPLREIVDRDRASRAHNGQRDGEGSSFVESGDGSFRRAEKKDRYIYIYILLRERTYDDNATSVCVIGFLFVSIRGQRGIRDLDVRYRIKRQGCLECEGEERRGKGAGVEMRREGGSRKS